MIVLAIIFPSAFVAEMGVGPQLDAACRAAHGQVGTAVGAEGRARSVRCLACRAVHVGLAL